jgi:cardiolipin synthase A/B
MAEAVRAAQGIPRRWRRGIALDPRYQEPKGQATLWTRARKVLWSWWPWFVVAVATAYDDRWGWAFSAGAMAFVSYLVTPIEASPQYGLEHEFSVDSDEFLTTITGASGVPVLPGNRIDVLHNGDEFYPVMLEEIARAKSSITIEAYIYWAGAIGRRFADALAAKAGEGIPVKILLDAVGSATIGSEILETLEEGGCQLAWYNRIHWYTIGQFNHRTHRKSLIIDGRVGFTGGAGIADVWLGHAQSPEHWRDTQIRITGPAVTPLQTGFSQNWLKTTGELLSGETYYPEHDPPSRGFGATSPASRGFGATSPASRGFGATSPASRGFGGTSPASRGFGATNLSVQTVMSSPESGASSVRLMHYLPIVCARRSIYISNPYFVPDQAAIDTLVEARQRGVDVRIMVAGRHNDTWLARQNSRRLYGPLLRAGIQILEYNQTFMHQKTMVVDGLWVSIGTTNFDNRSFAHNEETSVCIKDAELATFMEQTFRVDMRACDHVELEAWQKRGVLTKSLEAVASLLEAQV